MKAIILCLSVVFLFNSCCKEDPSGDGLNFNFSVGDFWIYESGSVDENGILANPKIDTVKIVSSFIEEGHEIFNFNKNFLMYSNAQISVFDSAGYLLSYPNRDVILTNDQDYIATIDDPYVTYNIDVPTDKETVSVKAGEFLCTQYRTSLTPKEQDYPHTLDPQIVYFASGVGVIKSNAQYYASGQKIERRLLDYKN